jgi:aspartate--ammonia ligase
MTISDKEADLAGPGIGNYEDLEKVLPADYEPPLDRRQTQEALFEVKRYIEDNLCRELNLMMVTVPLIVDVQSGVNDMLDRDGSRTPIQFHISNDRGENPIDAQVVQAATKWKRVALKQFGMAAGEGICTDMRAVRKDYFLDHDHSAYVDQWDWERVITEEERNLDFLTDVVKRIWRVLKGAETHAQELFPQRNWRTTGTRACPTSSPSFTPRIFSIATRIFRGRAARPRFCRSTRPSSSTASDGL